MWMYCSLFTKKLMSKTHHIQSKARKQYVNEMSVLFIGSYLNVVSKKHFEMLMNEMK